MRGIIVIRVTAKGYECLGKSYHVNVIGFRISAWLIELVRGDLHDRGQVTVVGTGKE